MSAMTREEELVAMVNSLVASSVETHRILGTPNGSALTLTMRAAQVMAELTALKERLKTLNECG